MHARAGVVWVVFCCARILLESLILKGICSEQSLRQLTRKQVEGLRNWIQKQGSHQHWLRNPPLKFLESFLVLPMHNLDPDFLHFPFPFICKWGRFSPPSFSSQIGNTQELNISLSLSFALPQRENCHWLQTYQIKASGDLSEQLLSTTKYWKLFIRHHLVVYSDSFLLSFLSVKQDCSKAVWLVSWAFRVHSWDRVTPQDSGASIHPSPFLEAGFNYISVN